MRSSIAAAELMKEAAIVEVRITEPRCCCSAQEPESIGVGAGREVVGREGASERARAGGRALERERVSLSGRGERKL